MQNNKACGPDGIPTESLRCVDKIDPMLNCDQINAALEKGIPTVWRTSILTPLNKGKCCQRDRMHQLQGNTVNVPWYEAV